MGRMGPTEWIIILIVVLLLFGGKKIPELMKGLGRGIKDFKDASKGNTDSSEIEKK
jgi:sec-independent protein translocase protein TatA